MDEIFNFLGYGNFIIVLCVLIFVHELGHYLVARICGVKVEVFSIGFGREIFGWTDRAGTRWKFSLIPLGGYVKMLGEAAGGRQESDLNQQTNNLNQQTNSMEASRSFAHKEASRSFAHKEASRSFAHKSLAQRAAVVAAGPGANFLFAILAFALIFMTAGRPTPPDFTTSGIADVMEGSAAAEAGLRAGDVIVRANSTPIETFSDLVSVVAESDGAVINFEILRHGSRRLVEIAPRLEDVKISATETRKIYRLGVVAPGMSMTKMGIAESLLSGITETWRIGIFTLQSVGDMITGKTGMENMGGPVKIAQMSNDVGEMGGLAVLGFMAVLSINLGLLNLFPIPILDGGHLVFYFFEAILGRPLSPKIQDIFLRIGLALLLFLMLFVTINDISGLKF